MRQFCGGDMKGRLFLWCGGGRRKAPTGIKHAPAVSTGKQAISDPKQGIPGPINSRENSGAPAPPGEDPPGGGPVVTNGRAAKPFNVVVDWTVRVLAIAIAVVLVLWAYAAQPVQLADVTPQLNSSSSLYLGPFAVTAGGHVDHGNVPLQVTGMLTGAAGFVDVLELDTRPFGEPSWQKQTACCLLLGSAFTGSASLSVASAQAFDFQLVSVGNSVVLATGTLAVHLESFPGGSQQAINIIAALGAAAVVLEFLRFVSRSFRRPTGPEPAQLTRQGEPDA
jgi:hypothetical protein